MCYFINPYRRFQHKWLRKSVCLCGNSFIFRIFAAANHKTVNLYEYEEIGFVYGGSDGNCYEYVGCGI